MTRGRPSGLGATLTPGGVEFAVTSAAASAVELSLFDEVGGEARRRLPLTRGEDGVWRLQVADLGAGQLYGYRVDGRWDPGRGHRFNPAKLLVDPRARAVAGEPIWDEALAGGSDDAVPDPRDTAPFAPLSVVVDPAFDWRGDRRPRTPWPDTLIYECHVKGLTRLHPRVPPPLRGTYLGLVQEPVIEHLRSLGVTAVQLLPVQQFVTEPALAGRGLTNYFGYNPLAFFAPHAGYAAGDRGEQVTEFKTMVRALHRAGIEVLLDLVLNHTAEGDHRGPTLSLRGFDNRGHYRLREDDPTLYENWSGCGNTLDLSQPAALELILDCLRYWVAEMRVDGFRLDLAPVLGRGVRDFDPAGAFFTALRDDPDLARVKWIAEPWDLGPGGYQLGNFPSGWAEWNDRYRDTVRAFWRGDPVPPEEMADRLSGSPDVFGDRAPTASVNYLACHDGFTLADLVSYERKHNEANGEDNGDGPEHNLSSNWGAEGPTDDPAIRARRLAVRRALVATLALSRGVPMLAHGDELGRTQRGNNNAYCHDGELTWLDWTLDPETEAFLAFVREALALRRRLGWPRGEGPPGEAGRLLPARAAGLEVEPPASQARAAKGRGGHLLAAAAPDPGGTLVLLLNGGPSRRRPRLSTDDGDREPTLLLATGGAPPPDGRADVHRGRLELPAHALRVLLVAPATVTTPR